jgi:hypothetical protein
MMLRQQAKQHWEVIVTSRSEGKEGELRVRKVGAGIAVVIESHGQ